MRVEILISTFAVSAKQFEVLLAAKAPQAKRRCDAALLKVASRRQSPLVIYATLIEIEFSRSVDQRINPYHFLFRSFPLFWRIIAVLR